MIRFITGTSRPFPSLILFVDIVTPGRPVLPLENRTLLVVAGLPGAGKSTLLRDTAANPGVTLLDTDHMRARLRTVFPAGTPYACYRPLVHVLHIARLVSAAIRTPGPVVVHDPATGAIARTAFVVLGALTRRRRHLLWIDCTVPEALAGQRHRGRILPRWSFARHVRNGARLRRRLLAGAVPAGWCDATVTDRQASRHGMQIVQVEGQAPLR